MKEESACSRRFPWLAATGFFVILLMGLSTALAQEPPEPKVTICHRADAKQDVTITVANSAVPAHFDHGDTGGACPCASCLCNNIFDPVTCNGTAYANLCQAVCAGATECSKTGSCQGIFAPVVCADGQLYASACTAVCAGGTPPCETACACDNTFDPVTCPDGNTYANACSARCAGQGHCQRD